MSVSEGKAAEMQAFECTGLWWLPQDGKGRTAGTLKVSASGEVRLWLLGSLGQSENPGTKDHPIILGWVDKSPFGDTVTLSGCVMGGSAMSSAANLVRENYHASRAYFGAHLQQKTDFAFKSMSLRIEGLSEWAKDYSGFTNEGQPTGKVDEPSPVLSYAYRNPLEAKVAGGRLTFGAGLGSVHVHRERTFSESVGFNIVSDTARSAEQLNAEYVYPLQNLMTFVCDRPQEVTDFGSSVVRCKPRRKWGGTRTRSRGSL